jgi:formylglycine-generating enzyme required for sulfatase activity/tRNA A-37 threonylcarbamoyl transferase component Bud32
LTKNGKTRKITCPACGHEVLPVESRHRGVYACPLCEEEISVAGASSSAEKEIVSGLRPGDRLGQYEVMGLVGAGGMAAVLKARQLSLNRYVAIKILPKRFATNKLLVSRFDSEAAALAGLNHPNIVTVIDRGREGDIYYIAMELVEGEDLRKRLGRDARLKQNEALDIVRQVLAALQYAHDRGIVHRDIKPGNILITGENHVKVADFGLAHLTEEQNSAAQTHTGQMMGTLKYMAPEQLMEAKSVDGRADLYSTGVMLYEMLTGRLPVGAFKLPTELAPDLDHRLDDVILKAIRTDPEERYQAARELGKALEEIQRTHLVTASEQDQREFAVVEAAPTQVNMLACLKCGRESGPEARVCAKCGAPLDHLFEPCPACGRDLRVDVKSCPGCGANLRTHRTARRQEVMNRQIRIKQLVSQRDYEGALTELRMLVATKGFEYEQIRASARSWQGKVEKRLGLQRQQIYDAAVRLIAENNPDKARELLLKLPRDYGETSKWLTLVEERLKSAEKFMSDGNRALQEGHKDSALRLYEQSLHLRPHDMKLRDAILRMRNQLGNETLVRKYLSDARDAEGKDNYAEAIELCRRAAGLSPEDSSLIALMQRLKERERTDTSGSSLAAQPLQITTEAMVARQIRRQRIIAASALLLIAAACVTGYLLSRPSPEEAAAKRFVTIQDQIEKYGDLEAAIDSYSELASGKYAHTGSGKQAAAKVEELTRLFQKCQEISKRADASFARGNLAEAGIAYRQLLDDATLVRCGKYVSAATDRVRSIAASLAAQGKSLEGSKRLASALRAYEGVVATVGTPPPDVSAAVKRLRETIDGANARVTTAGEALKNGDLVAAEKALAEAAAMCPGDRRLPDKIHELLARKTPPEGMVYVPPGRFTYGSNDGDPDEAPQREITLDRGFYIDAREVANKEYALFVETKNAAAPPHWQDKQPPVGKDMHPVPNVSFTEAVEFAHWKGKRLPTDVEWERAARGEDGRRYPWGDRWQPGNGALQYGSVPTGSCAGDKAPSGCQDMGGNVAEWTSDLWPQSTDFRVVRGGSWAGPEAERSVRPVFQAWDPAKPSLAVLIDSPTNPVAGVLYPQSLYLTLRATAANHEHAQIFISKWLPEDRQWVSSTATIPVGKEITTKRMVRLASPEGGTKDVAVDFSTGCIFEGFPPGDDLVITYFDSDGVRRRMPKEQAVSIPEGKIEPRVLDCATLAKHSLKDIPRSANRLKAPANGRFLNVGFRCAATPVLLSMLAAPED